MGGLDSANIVPLFVQLSGTIRESIIRGELKYGEQVPPEMELAGRYEVSRNTVRRAISLLVEEGLLERKQGKGTFVKTPVHYEQESFDGSFTASVAKSMSIASTVILDAEIVKCPIPVAAELNLPQNSEIIYISRVRKVNGIPAIWEEDFFPMEYRFLLDIDLNDKSLFKTLLETSGIKPENSKMLFEAIASDKKHMETLNIGANHPILVIKQTVFAKMKPIYFNIQYVRSEVYKSSVYTTFPARY